MDVNVLQEERDFISHLLNQIPEFMPCYDEHLKDNSGELLPHVLLADFTRFLTDAYRNAISTRSDKAYWERILHRGLAAMDEGISSPSGVVQELVSVSFVENLLPYPDGDKETYRVIASLLTPNLRNELRLYDPGIDN